MATEDALGEAESIVRVRAGEALKREFPDTWAGVSLSDTNRTFEPWVILCPQSNTTLDFDQLAFAPLHQRPTSPLGHMGVEIGHVVVGRWCPGLFMGFFHPEGDAAAEKWAIAWKSRVMSFLQREIDKIEFEVRERCVVAPNRASEVTAGEMDLIVAHLGHFKVSLEGWKENLENGNLSSVPRMEG